MYREQIARGAALLDEHFPDWEWRINLDALRLDSCIICVVGQLAGEFETDKLFGWKEMTRQEIAHGFYLQVDPSDMQEYWRAWNGLTEEWKSFILERRKQRSEQCSCSAARRTSPSS